MDTSNPRMSPAPAWWRRLVLLLPLLGALSGRAADPAETRAADGVVKMFQDGLFEAVERDAAEFRRAYPASERAAEIVLTQAQARIKLKRFDDAVALLAETAATAGRLADEFAFWQATAHFEKGDFPGAADGFAAVAARFPDSPRRLEAIYDDAYARSKAGETARATALLRDPAAAFQPAARAKPADSWTIRGWLLLAEFLLAANDPAGAADALKPLESQTLAPPEAWRRSFLQARGRLAAGQLPAALESMTNLWSQASNSAPRELQAEAVMLNGEILERLGQADAALSFYEKNLDTDLSPPRRQFALQKTIALSLRDSKPEEVAKRLEGLIARHPQDDLQAHAHLALGELRLRQYSAVEVATPSADQIAARSNLLAQARGDFDLVAARYPQSGLVGRAQLNRGWCFWEEGTNRLADGLAAFKAAVEQLPPGADQTIARFKLADSQFLARDFPNALSNYWSVATNRASAPAPTNSLSTQALYQIVRAGIEAQDFGASEAAMSELLKLDPTGELADRSSLLYGQALNRQGRPEAARILYEAFVQRATNSVLLPEVRLAIAHTFQKEQNWPTARSAYEAWLHDYGGQTNLAPGLRAQASFELAQLTYQGTPDTNSLALLTNFVAQFPDSTNAPLAQYLAAMFFYNQGDYATAELLFQDKLFAQPAAQADALAYQARRMAGVAAFARQSYESARNHFDWLITNGPLYSATSPVPIALAAEAYLFRGDTFLLEEAATATNKLDRYGEAITAFSKIVTPPFPTNALGPRAWGRIGDCQLTLATATRDTNRFAAAAAAYQNALGAGAEVAVRSMAEVGLGIVLEKEAPLHAPAEQTALLDRALDHYTNVLYGKNLRDGEQPDPWWIKKAGLAAADLAEAQKKWEVAIGLCRRLVVELPPLRPRLEKRIAELEKLAVGGPPAPLAPAGTPK